MSIKVEATGPDGFTTWNWYISADSPTLHREDGPAVEVFDPDGKKIEEQWVQHGKFHRTDGPAVTGYGFKVTQQIIENDDGSNEIIETKEDVEDYEYWVNPGIQNGGPPTESVRVETLNALVNKPEQWLIDLALKAKEAGYEGVRKND